VQLPLFSNFHLTNKERLNIALNKEGRMALRFKDVLYSVAWAEEPRTVAKGLLIVDVEEWVGGTVTLQQGSRTTFFKFRNIAKPPPAKFGTRRYLAEQKDRQQKMKERTKPVVVAAFGFGRHVDNLGTKVAKKIDRDLLYDG
jgi:hypothetical protein